MFTDDNLISFSKTHQAINESFRLINQSVMLVYLGVENEFNMPINMITITESYIMTHKVHCNGWYEVVMKYAHLKYKTRQIKG